MEVDANRGAKRDREDTIEQYIEEQEVRPREISLLKTSCGPPFFDEITGQELDQTQVVRGLQK